MIPFSLGAICQIIWLAWSLCTTQYLAPPFVSWALDAGWEVTYHLGSTCWVLTDAYTPEWRFCVDGTGENVLPWPSTLSP